MIELKEEQANEIYEKVKKIILSKESEPGFHYEVQPLYIYELDATSDILDDFYNEIGKIEFQDIYGRIVGAKITRWHPPKYNGWSGLNSTPCLFATIYIKNNRYEQPIWELNVDSGTLYYKARVTSLEIPNDIFLQDISLSKEKEDYDEEGEYKAEPVVKMLNYRRQ